MLQLQHFCGHFIGIFSNIPYKHTKKAAEKSVIFQTFPPLSEAFTCLLMQSYLSLKVAHAVSLQSHAPQPLISTCSA
jgi:hypothetical protein